MLVAKDRRMHPSLPKAEPGTKATPTSFNSFSENSISLAIAAFFDDCLYVGENVKCAIGGNDFYARDFCKRSTT